MPRMSDTMTEGVIVDWHKKVGDAVKTGDLLAEVETDKATMELESYQSGTLLYVGVEKGKAVQVDGIIAILGKPGEDISALLASESKTAPVAKTEEKKTETQPSAPVIETKPIVETIAASTSSVETNGRIKASPLAKKIAREQGVDIHGLKGSGDDGRIVRRDVEAAVGSGIVKTSTPMMIPLVSGKESFEEVPVSQMRKAIAKRLTESKNIAPHFYLTMEMDMDGALESRKALNEISTVKISFNDIIIKACALALRHNPKVNSSWLGDRIRYNHHIHIGMAVAIEDGLIVPVIRFADQKTLTQIAMESKDFATRAKERKLQPQEWEGNTFTVSNLGMYDIEEFTAIINPPDACILAIGGIKQIPVVKNGEIKIGNVMKVTLSCDHRAVDGATGSQFLLSLKSFLENPVRLLL